jgi:hypothetical protein
MPPLFQATTEALIVNVEYQASMQRIVIFFNILCYGTITGEPNHTPAA